ncbi:MAG: glutamate--tRNA ligase [Patescibacteria group bacterium]|jgi:glutamyl-tRNA synthetase
MSEQKKERTRFAPSPTGLPHIGSVWIALVQWLHAKSTGGDFIIRIEDTDRTRFVPEAEAAILETLKWYGLGYDEGPDKDGAYGPYRQSERLELYKKYVAVLKEKGAVYPCFCSTERLQTLREEQQKLKLPTGYDRHCRALSKEVANERSMSEPHVLRLMMPTEGETTFSDVIRGDITFANNLIDDQVLVKTDGWPTYHLAVVVDDHLMEITTVIRGEEWISSTPKHLMIYKALDWDAPQFAHMPLILGADRSKLGKRHGAMSALSFRDAGYLPEAMVNFFALLGWHPKGEEEILSRQEIIEQFRLSDVHKSGALFDQEKLGWMNSLYIKKLPPGELLSRALPFLFESNFLRKEGSIFKTKSDRSITEDVLLRALLAARERISRLNELPDALKVYLDPNFDYDPALLVPKKSNKDTTIERLRAIRAWVTNLGDNFFEEQKFESELRATITKDNLGVGETLWPLRTALSGEAVSPSPFTIACVIGKASVLERIDSALVKLTNAND